MILIAALVMILDAPTTPALQLDNIPQRLAHCRSLANTRAKAACYDAITDSLEKPVVGAAPAAVSDRAPAPGAAALTAPAQFGYSPEHLANLAARKAGAPPVVARQTKVIAEAHLDGAGRWLFKFEDGSVWAQTDTTELGVTPRPGMEASIERASLGSFLMTLKGRGAIRVARRS